MKFIYILSIILAAQASQALTVFSDRGLNRLKIAVDSYEQATGDKVNFVEGSYEKFLDEIIKSGERPDIIIVKDLVYMGDLVQKNLMAPAIQKSVLDMVHPSMRDDQGKWIALSYRTRGLIYDLTLDPAIVNSVNSYEDLAKPEFANTLCVRTSNHSYNYGLGAYLLVSTGFDKALNTMKGWVSNFAKAPFTGDRSIIAAVANGECAFGIVNNYYVGAELSSNPNLSVGYKAFVDDTGGSHTNGSAAGIVAGAQNPKQAQEFISHLFSDKAQFSNAASHFDYPAKIGVAPTYLPRAWQNPKLSPVSWSKLMDSMNDLPKLFESAGYQ